MNESERMADELRRAYAGESWQGPSLRELLDDVGAQQAAHRPIADAHSIWELVLHVITWHAVVRRRMSGVAYTPPDEENFPAVGQVDEARWTETREALGRSSELTAEAIRGFGASRMEEIVPGKGYDYRHMLNGVAHHDAYHAGQIALLKKARSREP